MVNYNGLTDLELTALLKDGDQYAYTEIFERYHIPLINHAYQLLQNKDEASDLVQDILLNLWLKREELQLQTSLAAYLFRAVKNKVFNLLAHQKVADKYLTEIGAFIQQSSSFPDQRIREKEMAAIIEREIQALPHKMRTIFLLNKEEKLNYQQIAEKLNISDQTAKLQVHNALKRLKSKIGQFFHLLLLF